MLCHPAPVDRGTTAAAGQRTGVERQYGLRAREGAPALPLRRASDVLPVAPVQQWSDVQTSSELAVLPVMWLARGKSPALLIRNALPGGRNSHERRSQEAPGDPSRCQGAFPR